MTNPLRASAGLLGLVIAPLLLGGCGVTGPERPSIALLLPESKTTRYESLDRPYFEAEVERLGDYDVLYSNADQDAAKQQSQAEAALASGVDVLVLDPVDSGAAATIVASANAQGIPVVAYDRIVTGGELDYYVSFENRKIGELQGEALVEGLEATGAEGGILMVHGSPTDGNAALFKEGALSSVEASGIEVLAQFDTPDWSPDKAQEWVAGQITVYGDRIAGVYAANDGTAGGAISAFKAADGQALPLVTGQDAELAGIQRIVSGDQYMTIYKPIREQAAIAAGIAVDLLEGRTVEGETTFEGVPSTLLEPVVVTVDDILDTVVADGLYTIEQICTADYAAACEEAGIR